MIRHGLVVMERGILQGGCHDHPSCVPEEQLERQRGLSRMFGYSSLHSAINPWVVLACCSSCCSNFPVMLVHRNCPASFASAANICSVTQSNATWYIWQAC